MIESLQKAERAHRMEEQALEEIRLLLYAERTADDPELVAGMRRVAKQAAAGAAPDDALPADEFVARMRARRAGG